MKTSRLLIFGVMLIWALLMASCANNEKRDFVKHCEEIAEQQTSVMLTRLGEPDGENYPRTTDKEGSLRVTGMREWTSGFFPGLLWYLYELTGQERWRDAARQWTNSLEELKSYTRTHDIGFMMYCSYGNAERLSPQPKYEDILIETANSLLTRFNENTNTLMSWNGYRSWDGERRLEFPVIIDNMMNLELLFYASKATGDPKYYDVAVRHADATMKNHIREDYSSYHVVGYNPETGEVEHRVTSQGYSDNSTWARGQAWAIYGFTMAYRETQKPEYLETALGAADYYLSHVPEDMIPLWDFNVEQRGYKPDRLSHAVEYHEPIKDASAAAIVCSAFFELGQIASDPKYTAAAVKMLYTLGSGMYLAGSGNNNFLIKHCVGSIPHNTEIDVPLVYADYYFLEALTRYKNLAR